MDRTAGHGRSPLLESEGSSRLQVGETHLHSLGDCPSNSLEHPQILLPLTPTSPTYSKAFPSKYKVPDTISQGIILFYSEPGQHDGGHRKIRNVTTHCRGEREKKVSSSWLIFAALAMDRICTDMLIFYKNSKSYYTHASRPKIHNDTLIQLK